MYSFLLAKLLVKCQPDSMNRVVSTAIAMDLVISWGDSQDLDGGETILELWDHTCEAETLSWELTGPASRCRCRWTAVTGAGAGGSGPFGRGSKRVETGEPRSQSCSARGFWVAARGKEEEVVVT